MAKVSDSIIAALIKQESGGNRNAISPKGAMGIAQIMGPTARDPGFGIKPLQNDSDEEQRRFANDYLDAMLKRYGGNLNKALAAYNAGPGNVDKYGGVPPFKETQGYVKNIMSSLNPISSANASETPALPPGFVLKKPTANTEGITLPPGFVLKNAAVKTQTSLKSEPSMDSYEGHNIKNMGPIETVLTGIGNKTIDLGRGAVQIFGVAGDKGFGSDEDIRQSRQLSESLGKSTSGKIGNFAGDVLPFMMTGGGSTIPSLVAKSAAMSTLNPVLDDESRVKNAAWGAGTSLIVPAAGKAIKGFKPSKDALELMKIGVQPTVGQGIEQGMIGKAIRGTEEATKNLPFLGAITQHARNRSGKEFINTVFKQAESKPLGVSAEGNIGHEGVAALKKTFNKAYESTLAGHEIPIKPELSQNIGEAIADTTRFLNTAERAQATSYLQGLFDSVRPSSSGKYLASDIRKMESKLSEKIRGMNINDDTAKLLNDAKNIIVKYREANLPAEVGKTIKELNKKYAVFKRIERAAGGVGAEKGEFSPAQLYNASLAMGKGGKSTGTALLQDLAGRGKSVISDKLNDSGTAPRLLTNKMLAGTALETGAALASLPKMVALGAGMYAGSLRPMQKVLLGGYGAQKVVGDKVNNKLLQAMMMNAKNKENKK